MDDATWLALCCYEEARNQPDDGVAAIARVVLNRAERKYASDGTIKGTVTHPSQFSWCEYDMVDGHYQRVARGGPVEIEFRAIGLLKTAQAHPVTWQKCLDIGAKVHDGSYVGGEAYQKLGPAVLYYNPAVVHPAPAWADPAKLIATIKDHAFYRA